MKDTFHIIQNDAQRIEDYFLDRLDADQRVEFEKWLAEDPAHAELTLRIRDKIIQNIQDESSNDPVDFEHQWNKFQKHLRHNRLRRNRIRLRIVGIAAAIAIPICCAVLLHRDLSTHVSRSEKIVQMNCPSGEKIIFKTSVENSSEENRMREPTDGFTADSLRLVEMKSVIVPRKAEISIYLPDGSTVFLMADSRIKYPSEFRGNRREVYFEGQAFFSIKHNDSIPFIVNTPDNTNIEVQGTEFFVGTSQTSHITETILLQGRVKVRNIVMAPGEKLVCNSLSGKNLRTKIDPELYLMRKNNIFAYEGEELKNIMDDLHKWYDFDYEFSDPDMASQKYSFKIQRYEKIEQIFSILELMQEIEFRFEGNKIIIYSGKN